jgi:exosortase F-associated protein
VIRNSTFRFILGGLCLCGLLCIYLFQKTDIGNLLGIVDQNWKFVVNKSIRFLANDALMIGLLYSLFTERKYVIFALWVQLAGLAFFLIPYFVLKLAFNANNGPLVSFLHRLILNPTLLIMLIPAFYYQKLNSK